MSKLGIGLCTLGLLASPFLCHGCHKEAIQKQLTQNAIASLEKSGLNNYKISFDGSDAVLSGPTVDIEKAKTVTSSVCPPFYTIKTADSGDTTPSPAPLAKNLSAFGLNSLSAGKYELSGVFPTEEARGIALKAAHDTFGAENVIDKSTVEANAEDSSVLGAAFGALKSVEGLAFQREGNELVLRGTVASETVKSEIEAAVRKVLPEGTTLRNELVVKTSAPVKATATPAPLAAAVTQVSPDTFTVEVLFDTSSAVIKSISKPGLNKLAAALKAQSKSVEVQGHTDNRGSEALNQPLSQRRADAVKAYLIQQSVAASTLTAKGYGSTQPRADNSTDDGRRKNRRIDFKIK